MTDAPPATSAALDARVIAGRLRGYGINPSRIEVLPEVDSTNRYLLEAAPEVSGAVCLAEAQRHGRGRQARQWISTAYSNLMLSFAWRFQPSVPALPALGLAAGLGVLKVLERAHVVGAVLKWPNDICWNGRKLCGVLAESRSDSARVWSVLGIGINVHIGAHEAARIDQPWVDLQEILGIAPDRNRLGADVIAELWSVCERYALSGFEAFRAEWNTRHGFNGKTVQWRDGTQTGDGLVVGAAADGALEVRDDNGQLRRFRSGEISLRQATATA